jgi:hypothetical protein
VKRHATPDYRASDDLAAVFRTPVVGSLTAEQQDFAKLLGQLLALHWERKSEALAQRLHDAILPQPRQPQAP